MSLLEIANPVPVSQTLFAILAIYVKEVSETEYKIKRLEVLLREVKKKMAKSKKLKFDKIEILKCETLSVLKKKEEEPKPELMFTQLVKTH